MSELENTIKEYETKLQSSAVGVFNIFGNGVDFNNVYGKSDREVAQYLLYYTDNTDIDFINSKFTKDTDDEISTLAGLFLLAVPKKYYSRDFYFSITNENTSRVIREGNNKVIPEITRTSKKALINNIYHSLGRGLSPYAIVQEYKATVGMSEVDELAVYNYRRYLEEGDRSALQRRLRDTSFDDTIKTSFSLKEKLPKTQIEEITNSYRDRLKAYRAKTIAENEALRAAGISQYESIVQAKTSGVLDTSSMRRFWVTAGDEKVRMNHRAIPSMNPDGVAVDGYFRTPGGNLKYPRDPNGSLSNIMNCRCKVVYKIVY